MHAAINVFSVAVMSIYLSVYPALYREWLIALFPPIHRDLVRDVLSDLRPLLRAYIVGQLLAMIVLAVLTALGLYLLDVPYYLTVRRVYWRRGHRAVLRHARPHADPCAVRARRRWLRGVRRRRPRACWSSCSAL